MLAPLVLLAACAHPVRGFSESGSDAEGVPDLLDAQSFAPPIHKPAASPADGVVAAQPLPMPMAWKHYKLPGKAATKFRAAKLEGRKGVGVSAQASASMLRYKLRVAPQDLLALKFSWKVPSLIEGADLSVRELDDSPVRIVLAFEGDYAKFSARNAVLSELSRSITGEPLPYATLMYVWSNLGAPESVVHNPRTDRIRKVVVESGGKNLGQWLDYERDIRADFVKAFGEEPGALLGVALMTDTDNTRSSATAWYGPVSLQMAPRVAATGAP